MLVSAVPTAWNKMKVVFIPDVRKTEYASPEDICSISIICSLRKTLERRHDTTLTKNGSLVSA